MKTVKVMVIFKNDNEMYTEWVVDLPENIFEDYQTDGGSFYGNKKEIIENIKNDIENW